MFVIVEDEKVQYVKPEVIFQLDELYDIMGYSNNSTFYRLEFIAHNNVHITCVGYDWSEYLQMINYARQVVKKNYMEGESCVV